MGLDVVAIEIPFHFGLEALDDLRLHVTTVKNRPKCDTRGTATQHIRTKTHLFKALGDVVSYTAIELERLLRHFVYL